MGLASPNILRHLAHHSFPQEGAEEVQTSEPGWARALSTVAEAGMGAVGGDLQAESLLSHGV